MSRTPQPLHIFQKDLMHLWPETLIVVALFAAFAWVAPSRWSGNEYLLIFNLVAVLLKLFLMPISWLVVISRLIQDESLVGDRQFWTSRPYHWLSLLAAKLLYLVVFLYLPFLLMQIFLLKHAGLYPTTVIPALLKNLLLLTVIVVVPITAISVVTSSFARALLAFIGTVIYVLVISLLLVWMVFTRMPPPGLGPVFAALVILLPAIAIVFQYATRRTAISRAMLIATPLLIALILLLTPATALIRHAYPVASQPAISQLPAGLGPTRPQDGDLAVRRGQVQLGLPITVSDGDKDSSYPVEGLAVTVDAPGVHWSSPYTTSIGAQINPSSPFTIIPVVIPVNIFNQVAHAPADVHLSLAANQFKADPPSTWTVTREPFSVPGHGVCSFPSDGSNGAPSCSYPFEQPSFSYVSATLSQGCGDASAAKVTGTANLSSKGTFLDFDPVVSTPMDFESSGRQPGPAYQLCPGTPLRFVEARDQGRKRFEVEETHLLLENYATHQTAAGLPGHHPIPNQ